MMRQPAPAPHFRGGAGCVRASTQAPVAQFWRRFDDPDLDALVAAALAAHALPATRCSASHRRRSMCAWPRPGRCPASQRPPLASSARRSRAAGRGGGRAHRRHAQRSTDSLYGAVSTAGSSDLLAVLDAEREALAARERLAQATTAGAASLMAVYKALAGGW